MDLPALDLEDVTGGRTENKFLSCLRVGVAVTNMLTCQIGGPEVTERIPPPELEIVQQPTIPGPQLLPPGRK